jgi:hypothetical protein
LAVEPGVVPAVPSPFFQPSMVRTLVVFEMMTPHTGAFVLSSAMTIWPMYADATKGVAVAVRVVADVPVAMDAETPKPSAPPHPPASMSRPPLLAVVITLRATPRSSHRPVVACGGQVTLIGEGIDQLLARLQVAADVAVAAVRGEWPGACEGTLLEVPAVLALEREGGHGLGLLTGRGRRCRRGHGRWRRRCG